MSKTYPFNIRTDDDIKAIANDALDYARCHNTLRLMNVIWPQSGTIYLNLCCLLLDLVPSEDEGIPLLYECMVDAKHNVKKSLNSWRAGDIEDIDVLVNFITCLIERSSVLHGWDIISESGKVWCVVHDGPLYRWWASHKEPLTVAPSAGAQTMKRDVVMQSLKHRLIERTDCTQPVELAQALLL